MFMKINFIFVCYLTISIKSAEINSNFELDESPRKNDSNTNRNDQKMSSQFSPNTAITVILNISTTLPQKTSNSVNLNSFTSTNTRKETLLVNTTYTTLKTKSKNPMKIYLTKTENPENPEKPKTNNNTHPIDVENSNKKAEHPKSSSKTKKNENAPTNSENSDKSQTKDQKTTGNIKPHKKTESTNSSHHDKSLTTKQIETTIHETVLNPEESKKVDPFKMKTTGSEKSQDSSLIDLAKPDENIVDNKLKKDEIKNSEDTNHLKRQKSQNLGETNDNSSSHFMIFIFFGLLFTIVAYVAFQKRKKIMAYVIEGRRRTSRSRRTSGGKDSKVSYKPLDSEDQEAGKNSYKYVY